MVLLCQQQQQIWVKFSHRAGGKSLEKGHSSSAHLGGHQGVVKEKPLCDLVVLNGLKRLHVLAFNTAASQ